MPIIRINSDYNTKEIDINSKVKLNSIVGDNLNVDICYPEITGVDLDSSSNVFKDIKCKNNCNLDKVLHIILYEGSNLVIQNSDCKTQLTPEVEKVKFVPPENAQNCGNDTIWFLTSKGYYLGLTKCAYSSEKMGDNIDNYNKSIRLDLNAQGYNLNENNSDGEYTYKIAAWSDLNFSEDEQKEMLQKWGFDTSKTADTALGFVTYQGNVWWPETDRSYFASFHNHQPPDYYLIHAQYNNHYLDLGSWPTTKKIMVKKTKIEG